MTLENEMAGVFIDDAWEAQGIRPTKWMGH